MKSKMGLTTATTGIGVMLMLLACTPAHKAMAPVVNVTPPAMAHDDGIKSPDSLFDPAGAEYLFSDNRAKRMGDIVLVNIVETSEAMNKASTKAEKDSSVDIGVEAFFTKNKIYPVPLGQVFGVGPNLGPHGNIGTEPIVKASTGTKFDGDGETKRESTVTATVAARVTQIFPNGLLQVEGSREIRVNGETQIIVLHGLVRAKDIGPNNSVSSNYLADAKIEYYGQGILADKQSPGWLSRALDNVWPF
jgi:flagellar L-ring protein FlgH